MKKEIIEWVKTIMCSLLIALIITTFASPTIVNGISMAPTLDNYDLLLINKLAYKDKNIVRGDIIVFKFEEENKNLIKRVIGVEGDTVEINKGIVSVNGIELTEKYIDFEDISSKDLKIVVPKDSIFVLGDNRNDSRDSRNVEIGTVAEDTILGKAYFRLFPFSKIGNPNFY